MASLDFLEARKMAAQGVVGRVTDDTPVALRIKQVGGKAVTSVTVTTGTSLVLIDADGTTTSTFATDTNIGKVCNTINATTNWEAKVLDALRTDATTGANTLINGAVTADADGYYNILWDTSLIKSYTYRLTYSREVGASKDKLIGSHRVHLKKISYFADVSAAEAGAVRVYKCKGSTETLIWAAASVDIADTNALDLTAAEDAKITGPEGYDLVIRVMDTTSLTNHASGYLQIIGILE